MTGAMAGFSTDLTGEVFAVAFFGAGLTTGFVVALGEADLDFGDLADALAFDATFADDFFVPGDFAVFALTERFWEDFIDPLVGFFFVEVIFTFL